MNKPRIILPIAIPGAGKTTFCHNFLEHNSDYIYLCADVLRGVIGQDESDQTVNGKVFENLHYIQEYFCKLQCNIILDETHYKKKYRSFSLNLAKKYNYEVFGITFEADLNTCLVRNQARERRVPIDVIKRFFNEYEKPEISEGFSEIVNSEDFLNKYEELHKVFDRIYDWAERENRGNQKTMNPISNLENPIYSFLDEESYINLCKKCGVSFSGRRKRCNCKKCEDEYEKWFSGLSVEDKNKQIKTQEELIKEWLKNFDKETRTKHV